MEWSPCAEWADVEGPLAVGSGRYKWTHTDMGNDIRRNEDVAFWERVNYNIPVCSIWKRLKRIDLSTYVIKLYLLFLSHISLKLQS